MADSTLATLLDALAALDSAQWRELAEKLRAVADACAEVPTGRADRLRAGAAGPLPGPALTVPKVFKLFTVATCR